MNRKTDNVLGIGAQVPKKCSVDSDITSTKIGLRKVKILFPDKLIVAHLNINSIRKKFDSLSMIENNVDILLTSKTKLDIHFHQANLKYVDLVLLIDMTEIQWVVDFYFISEMTLK